jgi:hypothetical protein
MKDELFNSLGKKAKRAPQCPAATLALYGPDDNDSHATKAVIGIVGDRRASWLSPTAIRGQLTLNISPR